MEFHFTCSRHSHQDGWFNMFEENEQTIKPPCGTWYSSRSYRGLSCVWRAIDVETTKQNIVLLSLINAHNFDYWCEVVWQCYWQDGQSCMCIYWYMQTVRTAYWHIVNGRFTQLIRWWLHNKFMDSNCGLNMTLNREELHCIFLISFYWRYVES